MTCARPAILLVSNRQDITTDFIAQKLITQGHRFARVNSEDITELEFVFRPKERATISLSDGLVSLDGVRSIFFRRIPSVFPQNVECADSGFVNRERTHFLEGLFLSLDARWVNPYWATINGERKVLQLALARAAGLTVPRTVVTNSSRLSSAFFEEVGLVVAKPISHGFYYSGQDAISIYTNELNRATIDPADTPMEAPLLLQERIENKADIRVIVVGRDIFAVAITKDDLMVVDWRRPEICKTYENHHLSPDLASKLIALVHQLGLVYGAIDLIQKPNGEYVFLEINPVGEWLWLELELGLPISNRIIEELRR